MADYSVKYFSLVFLAKVIGFLSGCCFIISDIMGAANVTAREIMHDVKDLYSCYAYPAGEYLEYVMNNLFEAWQFRGEIVAECVWRED